MSVLLTIPDGQRNQWVNRDVVSNEEANYGLSQAVKEGILKNKSCRRNSEVLLKLAGKPVLVIRQLEIGSSRANLGILQKATRRVVLVSSERPFF